MRTSKLKKSEKGQSTIEFMFAFPMILVLFFLMLFAAYLWHSHHLTAFLALDGARAEGINRGSGASLVTSKANRWMPIFGMDAGSYIAQTDAANSNLKGDFVAVYSQSSFSGIFTIPLLGVDVAGNTRAEAISPIWRFDP
jgi:hypothetical protein